MTRSPVAATYERAVLVRRRLDAAALAGTCPPHFGREWREAHQREQDAADDYRAHVGDELPPVVGP